MKKILLLALTTTFAVTACAGASSGEMEVKDAWARAALKDGNSAAYFTLVNNTAQDDELVGVSSDIAVAVEIHESMMDMGGTMKMSPIASVPVASGEKVQFKPGGLHVMLIGLKRDLKAGDEITIVLRFKNRAEMTLTIPVKE